MKSFLAILALLALSSAQLPVPIPSVSNISSLGGEWYIVWTFDSNINLPPNLELSCYEWDVSVDSDGGEIRGAISADGHTSNYTIPIEVVGTPNTVWDLIINWVALDPVSQSWATVAFAPIKATNYTTSAYILSRTPSLSNLVLNANIALLKGEQFPINATNQFQSTNTGCSSF